MMSRVMGPLLNSTIPATQGPNANFDYASEHDESAVLTVFSP